MNVTPTIIEINGHEVRFFPSPVNPGSKLLWVDVDSLSRAFRDERRVGWWQMIFHCSDQQPHLDRVIQVQGEAVYVCHYVRACGLLCAAEDVIEQDGYPQFLAATKEMLENV